MKILVTGCAGFIGFHLSKHLLEENNNVIGVDNINNYYDPNLKEKRLNILKKNKKFKFYKLDICNEDKIIKVFKKRIDCVINLAAQAGVRYSLENPDAYFQSNLKGFYNILINSKRFKIKHLIFASTSSVYGNQKLIPIDENSDITNPIQFYAATKTSNELMASSFSQLYQMKISALRFFTVYGPWGRPDMALFKFTNNILRKKQIDIYNFGKHKRDFTYIDDCVNAIKLIIHAKKKRKKFEVFNIANGKSEKLEKYIKIIEKELKLKAKKKYLPLQKGDIQTTSANINKIKKFVKYKPSVNIETGIKKFIEWYKFYYYKNGK